MSGIEPGGIVAGGGLFTPDEHEALFKRLMDDPLLAPTEKRRNHLMFTACFAILTSAYGVKVTKVPWLEFDVPTGAPNILLGALSIALIYTLVVFVVFVWHDISRWRLSGELLNIDAQVDRMRNAQGHLRSLASKLGAPDLAEISRERLAQNIEGGFAFLAHFDDDYRAVITTARRLKRVQFFRITVLDVGIPIALGVIGLCGIGWAVVPFMAAAFS